jgi:hypothetical protein
LQLKAGGHRVLIFSGMTRMLDIVQDFLTMQQYSFERLDGSIRGSERFDALNRFSASRTEPGSSDAAFVFLLSVRAGGQGLNLTQADTCIFLDSDFNPQVDLQAEDRVHRIGQQKPVLVLRLLSQKTVEEGILLSARKKAAVAHQVLGPPPDVTCDMSTSDVAPRALLDAILVGAQSAIDAHTSAGATSAGAWQCASGCVADAAAQGKGAFDQYFASCDWNRVLSRQGSKDEGEELVAGGSGTSYELDYQPLELGGHSLDVSRLQGQATASASTRVRNAATNSRAKSAKERSSAEAGPDSEKKRTESSHTRRAVKWAAAGYSSLRLPPLAECEEEHDADDVVAEVLEGGRQGHMSFVVGDVARPACSSGGRHFILHCVDSGGSWPDRGVFSALNQAYGTQIQKAYEFAARMKDLHPGDAHCLPLRAVTSETASAIHSVVLLVCLERLPDGARRIDLASFRQSIMALRLHCSSLAPAVTCHFHTPMPPPPCPWYAAERELRSQLLHRLPSAAISVYYFRRVHGRTSSGASGTSSFRESQTSRLARAFFSDPSHEPSVERHVPVVSPSHSTKRVHSITQPLPQTASKLKFQHRSPAAVVTPVVAPAAPSPQSQPSASSPSPFLSSVTPLFHGLKFGLHQLAWGTASLQV